MKRCRLNGNKRIIISVIGRGQFGLPQFGLALALDHHLLDLSNGFCWVQAFGQVFVQFMMVWQR